MTEAEVLARSGPWKIRYESLQSRSNESHEPENPMPDRQIRGSMTATLSSRQMESDPTREAFVRRRPTGAISPVSFKEKTSIIGGRGRIASVSAFERHNRENRTLESLDGLETEPWPVNRGLRNDRVAKDGLPRIRSPD
jgi:hypothetical protein